jgi:hypothetical protein
MTSITKVDFERLTKISGAHCVSIILPTHKSGKEVKNHQDLLLFKNSLNEVSAILRNYGLTSLEVVEYLKPAKELLEDTSVWHSLSNGLAVFLGNNFFEYYSLPVSFKETVYVSNHFFTSSLIEYFSENINYYLLTLSEHEVKLFECSKYDIKEEDAGDLLPKQLEEVVGYDYEPKYKYIRSNQSGFGKAVTNGYSHGHGEGKDDVKMEYEKYFKSIDAGIAKVLHEKKDPLIIAGVDFLYSIYKQVNHYKYLYPAFIAGNSELESIDNLHAKANDLIQDLLIQKKLEKSDLLRESSRKRSFVIEEIVKGALDGKIDTLFIRRGAKVYGQVDETNQIINMQASKQFNNTCLINLAANETFLKGGEVYFLESDEYPATEAEMNCIFRY